MKTHFVLWVVFLPVAIGEKVWPTCEEELEGCEGQLPLCPDCSVVDCLPALAPNGCPETSVFEENVLWGCCPACVFYLTKGSNCSLTNEELLVLTEELPCGGLDDEGNPIRIVKQESDAALASVFKFACGPDLDCHPSNGTCTYKEDSSNYKCSNERNAYDMWVEEGTCETFDWERKCSALGKYQRVQSKTHVHKSATMKFCSDPSGNRIFGDAPYTEENDNQADPNFVPMNCLCSRKRWELEQDWEFNEAKISGRKNVTLHCQSNGNYEVLQCDSGRCWCVDERYGGVTSRVVHKDLVRYLHCFSDSTFGTQYLRRCESRLYGKAYSNELMAQHELTWTQFTDVSCDADGSFGPVNCLRSESTCKCVDKYRTHISPYAGQEFQRDDMDCKCARDVLYGLTTLTCAKDGNYEELQQFAEDECCVDRDGFQYTYMYPRAGGSSGKRCKIPTCKTRTDYCDDPDEVIPGISRCDECPATCD